MCIHFIDSRMRTTDAKLRQTSPNHSITTPNLMVSSMIPGQKLFGSATQVSVILLLFILLILVQSDHIFLFQSSRVQSLWTDAQFRRALQWAKVGLGFFFCFFVIALNYCSFQALQTVSPKTLSSASRLSFFVSSTAVFAPPFIIRHAMPRLSRDVSFRGRSNFVCGTSFSIVLRYLATVVLLNR